MSLKTAELADMLRPALKALRCPRCGAGFWLDEHSLRCEGGHCYDLSARGYVNLAPDRGQRGEKYDAELFACRRSVFAGGFYAPVLEAVLDALRRRFGGTPFTLADVGCGEGYYSRGVCEAFPAATVFGADLSRDAILAAARSSRVPRWLVADLKRLPFGDGALNALLDVLTPADYAEFARVLAPDGVLIKLIPMRNYLVEARAALGGALRSEGADGERVLEYLKARARVFEMTEIRHTCALTPAQSHALLRMTPMTFSIPREALEDIVLDSITIHMAMVVCGSDRC